MGTADIHHWHSFQPAHKRAEIIDKAAVPLIKQGAAKHRTDHDSIVHILLRIACECRTWIEWTGTTRSNGPAGCRIAADNGVRSFGFSRSPIGLRLHRQKIHE